MSITINGATNTLTAASGLTIAGNTTVTGDATLGTSTANIFTSNALARFPAVSGDGVKIGTGSTTQAGWIVGYYGTSGYGGIWNTGVTPAGGNYALAANATDSILNGATSSSMAANGSARAIATSTGLAINAANTASQMRLGVTSGQEGLNFLSTTDSIGFLSVGSRYTAGAFKTNLSATTSTIYGMNTGYHQWYSDIGLATDTTISVTPVMQLTKGQNSLLTAAGTGTLLSVKSTLTGSADYTVLELSNAATTSGQYVGILRFGTSAASSVKDSAAIGSKLSGAVTTAANATLEFFTTGGGVLTNTMSMSSTALAPGADNTVNLGSASLGWKELFCDNGTINTSDARRKTEVSALSAAEINAAKQLAKEIGSFKFLAAVAEKGDAARKHIGMTVQRAIEIMQTNGLNPFAYSFICHDAWDQQVVEHAVVEAKAAVLDDDGNVVAPAVEAKDAWTEVTLEAGDKYSFRVHELLLFMAAGFEARLSALEAA